MRSFLLALALLPLIQCTPLPGNAEEYFDILGTGSQDWRLVFRGTAHIEKSIFDAYKNGAGCPEQVEDGCKNTDWKAPCQNHYRNNDAIENWKNVREVLYGIVDQGNLVKVMRFKGQNTDYLNWMSRKRLIDSCWDDLKKSDQNYFGVEGHDALHRRFFINNFYGGCGNDVGWTVVADIAQAACPWERIEAFPVIKYAAGNVAENFASEQTIRSADAVVVFVRYDYGKSKEYYDLFNKGKKEWRFAFRGSAKVGHSLLQAYQDGTGVNAEMEAACKTADWTAPCTSHWRNDDALDNWNEVDQVLFGIIQDGQMVKTALFNGEGTTNMDWFRADNVLKSCWSDLEFGPHLIFRVEGDAGIKRHFFMARNYGGCPNDAGWVVVADGTPGPCPWEKSDAYPLIKFAAGPTSEKFSQGALEADAVVVFLKYKKL